MADNKEPIAWFTRGEKHIPVFDREEPTPLEQKKDREISALKNRKKNTKNG